MSSENGSQEPRRDVRTTVEKIRRNITHASKDLASAGKTVVGSTSKFVQDVSPKVSATIDDSLERASETFKRTMTTIDKQTKPQQVKLLKAYRLFLSQQVDAVEKRLNELKDQSSSLPACTRFLQIGQRRPLLATPYYLVLCRSIEPASTGE